MRVFIFILAIVILNSCANEEQVDNRRQMKFEKLLGRQESEYLNEIISDFDAFLNNKYQNVDKESRFKNYLKDFIDTPEYHFLKSDKLFQIDSSKLIKYKKSNLFDKYNLVLPDSIWQDSIGVNVLYNNELETIITLGEQNNYIQELISDLKNKPIKDYTSKSPFYASLDSVKTGDLLITKYLNEKEVATDIGPVSLANGTLLYLDESSEYFAKRIFIMELYNP